MFWDQLLTFLVSGSWLVVLAFLLELDLHEACQLCQGVQRENSSNQLTKILSGNSSTWNKT